MLNEENHTPPDTSKDPLDCMEEPVEGVDVGRAVLRMSDRVNGISIEADDPISDPRPGNPIDSASWAICHNQFETRTDEQVQDPPAKKVAKPDVNIWQSDESVSYGLSSHLIAD